MISIIAGIVAGLLFCWLMEQFHEHINKSGK